MSTEQDYKASVEKRIDELRQLILLQVRDIHDSLTSIRADLREVKLRNERLESNRRRL